MKRIVMRPRNFLVVTAATLCGLAAQLTAAQPVLDGRARSLQTAGGGLAAGSAGSARGSLGIAGRRQGLAADGNGNVAAGSAAGFSTDAGAQGLRTRRFSRNSDGSVQAGRNASATGASGSTYDRSGTFTRDASGHGSGEGGTSIFNANTGVTMDASTSYDKGSGITRSASCRDASGNTVSCGSR